MKINKLFQQGLTPGTPEWDAAGGNKPRPRKPYKAGDKPKPGSYAEVWLRLAKKPSPTEDAGQ